MKIALLHLDLAAGPREENKRKLEEGMESACQEGADWIVTPEAALEGYFYKTLTKDGAFPVWTPDFLRDFQMMAELHHCDLFVCGGERDPWDGKAYASCFWIGKQGEIARLHRKMYSHQTGMEAWMTLGNRTLVSDIGGIRVGILICADAYYQHPADMMRIKGAELLLVPAGWPPGACCPDPPKVWETLGKRTGAVVAVCNQTGAHREMDMTKGKSAVIERGHVRFSYAGRPAVLLFDYDPAVKTVTSEEFLIKEVNE